MFLDSPDMWVALSLSVLAAAYNNLANRWRPFHGSAYVPLNVTFAVAMAILSAGTANLSRAELGLQGDLGDAGLPSIILALFAAGAFVLARSDHRHRIADERVMHLRGRALAFYVLVRIPLGTAVVEEVVFRGALFATWRAAGAPTLLAAVWTSVAFGSWHVAPTIMGIRINDPQASRRKVGVAVIGAVVLTTIAGLGLTWLRVESSGLVAPIVLHAGINSVAALAAVQVGSARHDEQKHST